MLRSTISQKSAAAARICRNIGSFVACANSNCFSKYLLVHMELCINKVPIYNRSRWEWHATKITRRKEIHKEHFCHQWLTSFEYLVGKSEACHNPVHTRQSPPPYIQHPRTKCIMNNITDVSRIVLQTSLKCGKPMKKL